MHINIAEVT